jgi:TolA-binding protein
MPRWLSPTMLTGILLGSFGLPTVADAQWPADLPLRRAIFDIASSDSLAAVLRLEELDARAQASERERADALLGQLYTQLGDARFVTLCASHWRLSATTLRDHLAALWLRGALDGSVREPLPTVDDLPGDLKLLAAAAELDRGAFATALAWLDEAHKVEGDEKQSIAAYLRAAALEGLGGDPRQVLRECIDAARPPLLDAALLWLATATHERGEDPSAWLERIDEAGSSGSRALHMRAMLFFERNEFTLAQELLERVAQDEGYSQSRDVLLTLGAISLESSRHEEALAAYTLAAEAWLGEEEFLKVYEASDAPQNVLGAANSSAWLLDEDAMIEADARLLALWADLRQKPPTQSDHPLGLGEQGQHEPARASLDAAERGELQSLRAQQRAARAEARRYERMAEEERALNLSAQRHRARGMEELAKLHLPLGGTASQLDSIAARLDGVLAQLEAVTDTEIARIARRTRHMSEQARRNARRMELVRQLYVEGPMALLDARLAEETPRPGEILERDTALADSLDLFQRRFAVEMPRLIARSSEEVFKPRLLGDAPRLRALAHALLDRDDLMHAALDSARGAAATSLALTDAENRALEAHRQAAAARTEGQRLEQLYARAALARARARLEDEREGVDYGLSAASYGVAADLADLGEDGPATVDARRAAASHLQAFLDRHAGSFARGEVRFRLADLVLLGARDDFHAAMDEYLRTKRGVPPQLDTTLALGLYRQILEEDTEYAHRDAARFHLGMILADQGDPAASEQLEILLASHPGSEFAQAAQHRRADLAFDDADFELAARYFEQAAEGNDGQITAMSLYKLGWCHSNRDRHLEAAAAFGRLLDLYAAGFPQSEKMDLEREARDDLVHALARAGGAVAFERFVAEGGEREYAPKVLGSLSQLLRNYSLFAEAIASDELYLDRYALRPGALDAGRRLLDSHRRHSAQPQIDGTQLELAERFKPGSAWAAAQSDSLLLTEASEFSRGGVRAAALRAHRVAKEAQGGDWSLALGYYRTLLELWPADAEAPRFSLLAGECALESKNYEEALSHFEAAAASDTASFREDAAWLRVVSCERWYEDSRAEAVTVGDDALAKRLLRVGEEYLGAHPASERAADLRWRAGNLRFLHAWYEDAAGLLAEFAKLHPQDERTLKATTLAGEAWYRLERFDRAAELYAQALLVAPAAGAERAKLAELVPHCLYRNADQIATSGGGGIREAAPHFASLAREWPGFDHAPEALYRAGEGYLAAGKPTEALEQWELLVARHREHELAPDAMRRICAQLQEGEDPGAAATALSRYADLFPEEADAGEAMLLAATLHGKAGNPTARRSLEDRYLAGHPEDIETALGFREARARAELAALGAASIQTLVAAQAPTELMRYLELTAANPEQAAPEILAEIAYRKADEGRADYESLSLRQPLEESLKRKQRALEKLLASLGDCAKQGVRPWAQASAYRIGESLVHFGQALEAAEAPAELSAEDLEGFREILSEQAWEFYSRGEEAWSRLLRDAGEIDDTTRPWIERTELQLYPRIAARFIHRPEAVYPRLLAEAPVASR